MFLLLLACSSLRDAILPVDPCAPTPSPNCSIASCMTGSAWFWGGTECFDGGFNEAWAGCSCRSYPQRWSTKEACEEAHATCPEHTQGKYDFHL